MSELTYIAAITRPAFETTRYEVTVPTDVLADYGYEADVAVLAVLEGNVLDGASCHVIGEPDYKPDPASTTVRLDLNPEDAQR